MMTNVEQLQSMVKEGAEMNLVPHQEMVVLLTSIASSLAVIADIMRVTVDDKE